MKIKIWINLQTYTLKTIITKNNEFFNLRDRYVIFHMQTNSVQDICGTTNLLGERENINNGPIVDGGDHLNTIDNIDSIENDSGELFDHQL